MHSDELKIIDSYEPIPEIILNMASIENQTLAFTNHGRILEFDNLNDVWIESHYSGRKLPPKNY